MKLDAREIAAALVCVISVIGIIILSALAVDTPPALAGIAGASSTWLFVHSSVQAEHAHADTVRATTQNKEAS